MLYVKFECVSVSAYMFVSMHVYTCSCVNMHIYEAVGESVSAYIMRVYTCVHMCSCVYVYCTCVIFMYV